MLSSTTTFFPEGDYDEDEDESFHSSLSAPLLLRSNTDGTISEQNDDTAAEELFLAADKLYEKIKDKNK